MAERTMEELLRAPTKGDWGFAKPDVPKTLPKPNIPYPSRRNDQKFCEKASNQIEKIFQIFQDLHFNISFANVLLLMPRFAPTIKNLLMNKLGKKKGKGVKGDLKEVTKAKSSIEEPPELELKDLPSHLEYAYLEGTDLPVIIAKGLKDDKKEALLKVLKSHKRAIAWKITDIKGIDPRVCTNKILMEEDYKPTVQSQRRVNPKIHEVIKKEVIKLLNAGMIYPISDSPWVSPIHCVPKKGGITVVANEENELIPTQLVTRWRVCIDYRKLNEATQKDHFPLPCMDQMLERLAGNEFYCFLDGFLGYFQIPIDPQDQEKTTFTCPYGTFAYRRMPFGLCNTPGHKISKSGIEVDQAKVDVIAKLPHPTTVKGVRGFLGHAGFYRRFIQDFSKIARPMTHLLEKETPFVFSKDCNYSLRLLKKEANRSSDLSFPAWDPTYELLWSGPRPMGGPTQPMAGLYVVFISLS
ncbi:hypothetical protein Tco_0105369 [Tanacetum coccineum]